MQGLDRYGLPKPGGQFDMTSVGTTPRDQRILLSSGPFSMAAGDTQDVWYAIIGARGSSHDNAVVVLKDMAASVRSAFDNLLIVGIREGSVPRPGDVVLTQNYPNPFNSSTMISYQLSMNAKAELRIYNLLGQEVRTLVNGHQNAGVHEATWDGLDNFGRALASGVYVYRLEEGGQVRTRKLVLLK